MDESTLSSRRAFLRFAAAAGLAGAAGTACKARLLPKETAKPAAATPPLLARGLAAMSRHHPGGWVPGHYGAALISAHYFVTDNGLDERAARAVEANAEAYVAKNPEEFPEPDPGAGTASPE